MREHRVHADHSIPISKKMGDLLGCRENLIPKLLTALHREAEMQNRLSPPPPALDDRRRVKQIKVQYGQKQHITCKGIPMRLSADFSKEILQARRE